MRGLRVFTACDHYARTLATCSDRPGSVALTPGLTTIIAAVALIVDNIDTLAAYHGDEPARTTSNQLVPTALHALARIDQAVVDLALGPGAPHTETASRPLP